MLAAKDYSAPALFEPTNLLREARRQRGLADIAVPAVGLLDPDGDIVRYLAASGLGRRHPGWACYHTEMWTVDLDGIEIGVVGMAVGAPFAVLVAEQLTASGAGLILSITSAGQISAVDELPCFVLIERAALGEILPMAVKMGLDPDLVGEVVNSGTGRSYASEFFIPRILQGNFTDGYPMAHAYKDLVSAAELGAERCIPMPVLAAATATYQTALLRGHGDKDKGAMVRVFEELLGVRIPQRATGPRRCPADGPMTDKPRGLDRGLTNYGDRDFARYLRRSFARSMGISTELLGKPIVGIAMTPSGLQQLPPLHAGPGRRRLARRAGGGRPAAALPDRLARRGVPQPDQHDVPQPDGHGHRGDDPRPADGRGGADRRLRQDRAGAADGRGLGRPAGGPARDGPMSTGRHQGQRLGACTDCRGFWAKYRAGTVDSDEIETVEGRLSVTAGTCAVMGTASTMACIAETLGMSLPGTAAIPAVHSDRLVAAEETGKAAVRLIASRSRRAGDHREGGRERVPRAHGARRLDQRHHPPDRHRRPAGHQDPARAAQRDLRRDAGAGRPQAGRRRLHGGLPCRRRHGGPAARAAAAAAPRHAWTSMAAPWASGWTSPPAGSTGPSSARSPSRSRRSAGWWRCRAAWRRTARSSSARRPRRRSSRPRAGPWSSPVWRT